MADNFVIVNTIPMEDVVREDYYKMVRTAVPTVQMTDDATLAVSGGQLYAKSHVPRWVKLNASADDSFTYADFTVAGLTEAVTAHAQAAGGAIGGVAMRVKEAFTAPALSALTFELGVPTDVDKYSGATTVDGTATGLSTFLPPATGFIESFTADTNIELTATAVGANLSAMTAGKLDVWVLYSNLINT